MASLVYSPTPVSDPLAATKTSQPQVMRPLTGPTLGGTAGTGGNGFQDFMSQLASWSGQQGGNGWAGQLQGWMQNMPNQSSSQTIDQYRQSVMDWRNSRPQFGMNSGGTNTQPAQGLHPAYQQQNAGLNAPPSAGDQSFYQSHGFYPGG